jgi:cytochrome c1
MPWRRGKVLVLLSTIALIGAITIAGAGAVKERERQKARATKMTGGNPEKAMQAIVRYGCAACHDIPGAQMPGGLAAPPLADVTKRIYLGGRVNNTPDNLVRWIVNPKQFDPKTGMPVTGVTDAEARDIAAYLFLR